MAVVRDLSAFGKAFAELNTAQSFRVSLPKMDAVRPLRLGGGLSSKPADAKRPAPGVLLTGGLGGAGGGCS